MNFIEILDVAADFYIVFIFTIVFIALVIGSIVHVVNSLKASEEEDEEEITDDIAARLRGVLSFVEYKLYDEKAYKNNEDKPDDEKSDMD